MKRKIFAPKSVRLLGALVVLLLIGQVGFSVAASASVISAEYQSAIDMSAFGGASSEYFSFLFTYDTSATPLNMYPYGLGERAQYLLIGGTIVIGAEQTNFTGGSLTLTTNPAGSDDISLYAENDFSVSWQANFTNSIAGQSLYEVGADIQGSGLLTNGVNLPLDISTLASLATYSRNVFGVSGVSSPAKYNAPFTISENPIPTTLPLFAGGLGVLGLLGWCRKKKGRAQAA